MIIITIVAGDTAMSVVTNTVKKLLFLFLLVAVIFLIIAAVYTNLETFKSTDTVRYAKVNLEGNKNIDYLVKKYSGPNTKDKFISEIKRVNDLDSVESLENTVILVPILETN